MTAPVSVLLTEINTDEDQSLLQGTHFSRGGWTRWTGHSANMQINSAIIVLMHSRNILSP